MRLFHLLRLFLIVEFSSGKLVSEDLGEAVRQGAEVAPAKEQRVFAHESANRDMVSINMFKVYEKYSKEPQSQRDGNTVRSFKAVPSEWPHEPAWAVLSLLNKPHWPRHIVYCRCFACKDFSIHYFMQLKNINDLQATFLLVDTKTK